MGKVEEYKKKLEKFEEQRAKEAKAFSIDEVLNVGLKEVYVPEIDAVVRYGSLTIADMEALREAKTDEERAAIILWRMLSKADENVTLEKVKALPIEVATSILNRITMGPLPSTSKRLKGGSERTRKPNLSV